MKRCPKCRRDYYDDSLLYCLDDGNALLEGPVSMDEPATAILSEPGAVATGFPSSEAPTRAQFNTIDQTAILSRGAEAEPRPSFGAASERQSLSAHRAAKPLIAAAVVAAVIALGGFFGYRYLAPAKQIESIAVMPFVNESGNADIEYLSDGMTETLIRSLSQLPNFDVKSRSSVFRYKGKDADAKTIGRELGVQAVLNGRVAQRGDQLTLNLELINAENEGVIWTDLYDRKVSDLVSLQNEIARDVSGKLRIKLSGAEEQKLTKNYTADPEAYRLYLQGRFYWNRRTFSEVAKGIPYFKQAIERDPNFALGYVGLADSDEDRDRPQKKEYIRKALEIDPDLAEAHASLGYQYMLDYDWTASERELRQAMELDPKYPQSYAWNGARLMMIGRYDEALAEIQRALNIDPTANGFNFYKGVCLGVAGRLDESVAQFKKMIEMDPAFPWAHSHLSRIYRLKGNTAAAVEERATAFELDGRPDQARGMREAYAKGGWDALERYMAENSQTESLFWSNVDTQQDKGLWLDRLETQAAKGNFWLFLIKTDPAFDPLRSDPRFQALVKKFDLPQ